MSGRHKSAISGNNIRWMSLDETLAVQNSLSVVVETSQLSMYREYQSMIATR
jgi:hypothetical protein